MKREKSIVKKSHMSILLLLLIVGIGIGFAALQTNLVITGETKINKVEWNVHFDNAKKTDNANVDGTVELDDDKTTATYSATLEEPGDTYEFTVDVVNEGSIDAILKSIEGELELTDDESKYFVYEITGIPAENTVLAKTNGKYTITVKLQYNPDVEAEDLPTELKTISKTVTLNYVQYKNSGLTAATDSEEVQP